MLGELLLDLELHSFAVAPPFVSCEKLMLAAG